jgi:glycosyltransferase involved in cell wall biosynthesis
MIDQAPYFSVITPSWNQSAYIEGCIKSVSGQGDPDFEHLIFDNCSTDSTAKVLSRYSHVRCVSEPDRGQSDAVNKGFLAAKGEIICWLNSDDAYPEGLFKRLRQLFADPSVDVVFGDVLQKNYNGNADTIVSARFERREDLVRWWSRDVKLHQPAIFFRRSVREKTGLLNESLHYAMDYEYWWRMSERHRFIHVPKVLAIQHLQPASKTVTAWPRFYQEREKIFGPYFKMIDGGDPGLLVREKRTTMARNYLKLAWSAPARSHVVWGNIIRALGEDPSFIMKPELLGLLSRALRGHG